MIPANIFLLYFSNSIILRYASFCGTPHIAGGGCIVKATSNTVESGLTNSPLMRDDRCHNCAIYNSSGISGNEIFLHIGEIFLTISSTTNLCSAKSFFEFCSYYAKQISSSIFLPLGLDSANGFE